MFRNENSIWNNRFKKISSSCCQCIFWRFSTYNFDRFDVTIQSMHIKKLFYKKNPENPIPHPKGLFLTQKGPNGNKRWFAKNRIATSAPLQIKIRDNVYISKNWNVDIQRNLQLEKYLQQYSLFSPIWRVKYMRDSTFEDLRALAPSDRTGQCVKKN